MTVLLVIALMGCVVTGAMMARGKSAEGVRGVRVHCGFAVALVLCAAIHAVGNLLG